VLSEAASLRPVAGARDWSANLLVGGIIACSGVLLLGTGNPGLAAIPPVLAAVLYLLAKLPIRYPLFAFSGIWVASDMLPRPLSDTSSATWASPLQGINNILANNLDTVFGVSALRFSGSDALFAIFAAVAGVRALARDPVEGTARTPTPAALRSVLLLAFLAVVGLELSGMATGGDFRQSLWQFRGLLWLPVLTLLFSFSLRGPQDFAPLGWLLVGAVVVKVAIGLYYLRFIAAPRGIDVDFMTCHEDSLTFVTTIMLLVATWAHRPTARRAATAALLGLWVFVGMAANERRLAYVSLAGSAFLVFLFLRGPVRRTLNRMLLLSLPLIVLYLAIGRNRPTGIFKPAALMMSVATQKDESSKTRDIENFNLLQTLKQNKLTGAGWGHEYDEQVKADDISELFMQYRYIAHNSVLWLWSIGGLVGFTLLWLPLVVGIFLARRGYAFARTPLERTAALTGLVVMASFINQAWGDMGTQGQTCIMLLAWALAVVGKLAVANGAVPARASLWGYGLPRPRFADAIASGHRT
jgi:hypothetical protein